MMYSKINTMESVFEKYSSELVKKNVVTREQVDQLVCNYTQNYEQEYLNSKSGKFTTSEWKAHSWEKVLELSPAQCVTSISQTSLDKLGLSLGSIPSQVDGEVFSVHPQIGKVYEQRRTMLESKAPLDWACAEALAFGALIEEGYKVRLSGEDVERGTFSHRHAVVVDQQNSRKYSPLKSIKEETHMMICNSHLSEQGVLGFEYGYSLSNPNNLVIWEAQFGDFFNGA